MLCLVSLTRKPDEIPGPQMSRSCTEILELNPKVAKLSGARPPLSQVFLHLLRSGERGRLSSTPPFSLHCFHL